MDTDLRYHTHRHTVFSGRRTIRFKNWISISKGIYQFGKYININSNMFKLNGNVYIVFELTNKQVHNVRPIK